MFTNQKFIFNDYSLGLIFGLLWVAVLLLSLEREKAALSDDWKDFRRKHCEKNAIPKQEIKDWIEAGERDFILTVVGVIDGDSVCAQDKSGYRYQIRLDGIDAPEYRQSYYSESKRFLVERIWQKNVCLVAKELDRYDRIIGRLYSVNDEGKCLKGNGEAGSVNLVMVREGWTWMYRYFFEEDEYFLRKDFEEAEKAARQKKIGLWQDPNPQNPYDCRRNKRSCR